VYVILQHSIFVTRTIILVMEVKVSKNIVREVSLQTTVTEALRQLRITIFCETMFCHTVVILCYRYFVTTVELS